MGCVDTGSSHHKNPCPSPHQVDALTGEGGSPKVRGVSQSASLPLRAGWQDHQTPHSGLSFQFCQEVWEWGLEVIPDGVVSMGQGRERLLAQEEALKSQLFTDLKERLGKSKGGRKRGREEEGKRTQVLCWHSSHPGRPRNPLGGF